MFFCGTDMAHDPNGPKALFAREWFARNGPPDAQPLPLGYDERETLKLVGVPRGISRILAWYARSLAGRDYDVYEHPSFHDYACGVMASEHAPGSVTNDEDLRKRFPPRALPGLDDSHYWDPPKKRSRKRGSRGRPTNAA
jgi:hypothetical protein